MNQLLQLFFDQPSDVFQAAAHTHTQCIFCSYIFLPVKLSSRRRSTIGERFLVCIFFDCQIPNNLNQLNLRKKPK